LDRVFTLKRDMNVAQFELIANALGVTTDHIVIAAEHWRTGTPPPGQTQSAVPDPRKLIRFLLDHPNQDQVLLTRLSEATGHVGGKGTRMKQLEAEIRSNRSEELTSALAALPSTDRATS
jgi:hypothetical protein